MELGLSRNAILALCTAAEGDGRLLHMKYSGGESFEAGGNSLFYGNFQKEILEWQVSFRELETLEYIQQEFTGPNSRSFVVTKAGYTLANGLRKTHGPIDPRDVREHSEPNLH